jgi:hypothetical protein
MVNSPSVPTNRIGAKGADAHRAKFRIAADDRVLGTPFEVVEPRCVDVIDFRFERALKAMIPVVQGCHDRHVVGFQHVQPGGEHIGQLAFVDENRRLTGPYCQFSAIFDLVAFAFKPPDHGIAGVIHPMNDVDEFAG